jgi:hypothetical protein
VLLARFILPPVQQNEISPEAFRAVPFGVRQTRNAFAAPVPSIRS